MNRLTLLPYVLLFLGVLMFVFSIAAFVRADRQERYVEGVGTWVRVGSAYVQSRRGGQRTSYISSFDYVVAGVSYHGVAELEETDHWRITPQVGKGLQIWYDPEHPETAVHDLGDPGAAAWLFLQAGLVFALFAWIGFGLIRGVRG